MTAQTEGRATVRVVMDITYELNGASVRDLCGLLLDLPSRLMHEGRLNRDTAAEVVLCDPHVLPLAQCSEGW